MYRFKNILFSPLSGHRNSATIERVRDLAMRNDARLALLGVAPEPSRLQRLLQGAALVDEVVNAERTRLEHDLQGWLTKASATAATGVEVGDPALRIIERVLEDGHDLVIVSSGEDPHDRATVRRLLRKCPCPVWVIRPTRARTQRVLAAVNPDPDEVDLNRTIVEMATAMVDMNGGELHIVHAWELYREASLRSSAFLDMQRSDVDALMHEEGHRHGEAFKNLLANLRVPEENREAHLVKGAAADVVPALVGRLRINLLVMGTVGRTGLTAMVMGNTAERVLDQVNCSVIAVKPDGFVSPIGREAD